MDSANAKNAKPVPPRHTVRSDADLERVWRELMSPLGFTGRALWLMVIDDDEVTPGLVEIGELPREVDAAFVEAFPRVLAMVAGERPGLRVAFLLARSGRGGADSADRAWAAALYGIARTAGVACEVVHLASDDSLMPIAPDDLPQRGAA